MLQKERHCLYKFRLVLIALLWSGLMFAVVLPFHADAAPLPERRATDTGALPSEPGSRIKNLGGGRFAVSLGAPAPTGEACAAFRRPDPVDPELKRGWQYTSSKMEISLPALAGGPTVVSTVPGDSLSFRLVGAGCGLAEAGSSPLKEPAGAAGLCDEFSPDSVSFCSIYPGMDERFSVSPQGLKHDVILAEPPRGMMGDGTSGDLVLRWHLELSPGLSPVIGGEPVRSLVRTTETILVYDENREIPFAITPARVFAARRPGEHIPARVTGATCIEPHGSGYRLELHVPLAWLLEPARAYPVRIDPSVLVYPESNPQTGYVGSSGWGLYARGEGPIDSGTLADFGFQWNTVNGYARFYTEPIPDDAEIQQVELLVWISNHDNQGDPAVPLPMEIHACPVDPLTASDQDLFNAIRDGQVYYSDTIPRTGPEFCMAHYDFFTYLLPAAAVSDLQDLLPDDRFSIGFTSEIVTDPNFDHLDYMGYPEVVEGECGYEQFPGSRIALRVTYEVVLAVKFGEFGARMADGGIEIYWTTEKEDSTLGFVVEGRNDQGSTPEQLHGDIIPAQGPGKPYRFVSEGGICKEYRIREIAADGRPSVTSFFPVRPEQAVPRTLKRNRSRDGSDLETGGRVRLP